MADTTIVIPAGTQLDKEPREYRRKPANPRTGSRSTLCSIGSRTWKMAEGPWKSWSGMNPPSPLKN